MSIRDSIVRQINRVLNTRGMELRAVPAMSVESSMDAALWRLSRLGIEVGTVLDVGAAAGTWSARALPFFPNAKFLLFEPLAERMPELTALRAANPRVDFVNAAVGSAPGEVTFAVSRDLDSSGVYEGHSEGARTVPLTTLDLETTRATSPAPYLIKLDTHGFEVPILEGAARCLAEASLLIIEAYNFQFTKGAPLFYELCAWLDARGFRPLDLVDTMRRPGDHALWQVDLVFARKDAAPFQRSSYQ